MRKPGTREFGVRGALIVALVLAAAGGFCMIDGDHDGDHHAGIVHVCFAMLAASFAPIFVIALLVAGSPVILSPPRAATVALGVLVPPPKFAVSL